MRKFIPTVLLVVGLAGLSYAAVAIESNGTKVKKTDTLNFVGPTVTAASGEVTIDSSNFSGIVQLEGYRNATSTLYTLSSSNTILPAANIVKNAIFSPSMTTASSFSMDSGANIAAASSGIAVGDTIPFVISNSSTVTLTLVGGSGTTLGASWTVPTLQSRTFYATYTGTNAFTVN